MTHNKPEHVASLCPHRHADAEFVRALFDRVRDNTVEANRGEKHRGTCKDRHEDQTKVSPTGELPDDVIHGTNPQYWQTAGRLAQQVLNRKAEEVRVHAGPDDPRNRITYKVSV